MCDLDDILHEQRLFKSAEEISRMRQAAQISVKGHLSGYGDSLAWKV
jgi:Xaa-Pro aminopeptidase